MVKVRIVRSQGSYRLLEFEGHAGFRKRGKDVVCAGVSVLFINTINSIEAFCEDDIVSDTSGKDIIKVEFPEALTERAALLIDSMILGLTEIRKEYGDKYLSLYIEEV